MNHAKTLTAIALASLLTVSLSATAANKSDFNKAASAAKASISKAKAANYEWRDSGKMLTAATKAAATCIELIKLASQLEDHLTLNVACQFNCLLNDRAHLLMKIM